MEFESGAKTFDNYMDLKAFLEDLFDRPVDLVVSDVIKPRLRDSILRETIYARDFKVYLEDILEAARKIRLYTAGLSFEAFCDDSKTAMP